MGCGNCINNDDIIRQGHIEHHPKPVTKKQLQIMLKQMDSSVFKIRNGDLFGTGFICLIPYPDESRRLPVLITCNHVLDINDIRKDEKITIFLDNKEVVLNIKEDRKIFVSHKDRYDITIIELKEDDYIYENNFLEIDNNIYRNDFNDELKEKTVYVLHYPKGEECEYSLDAIHQIKNKQILHYCATEDGSSGGPILNLKTYQVIGVHIGEHKSHKYNVGTEIRYPIEDFNKLFPTEDDKNEIIISIQIRDEDVNQRIYFLDNTNFFDEETNRYVSHEQLKELNNNNIKIYIEEKPYQYSKYFVPEKKGMYTIKIEFNFLMKNCSYMFYNCENIRNIDLSSFDTQNVIDMSYMFSRCFNLLNINLSRINTKNLKNMSNMFSNCQSLKNINLLSLNTENVEDMSRMFFYCLNLEKINVSKFNTMKVKDMSQMFNICPKLLNIDLSSFDISNEVNINNMFLSMNVINVPPPFSPIDDIYTIKAPNRVRVNENTYNKFVKILDKDILFI